MAKNYRSYEDYVKNTNPVKVVNSLVEGKVYTSEELKIMMRKASDLKNAKFRGAYFYKYVHELQEKINGNLEQLKEKKGALIQFRLVKKEESLKLLGVSAEAPKEEVVAKENKVPPIQDMTVIKTVDLMKKEEKKTTKYTIKDFELALKNKDWIKTGLKTAIYISAVFYKKAEKVIAEKYTRGFVKAEISKLLGVSQFKFPREGEPMNGAHFKVFETIGVKLVIKSDKNRNIQLYELQTKMDIDEVHDLLVSLYKDFYGETIDCTDYIFGKKKDKVENKPNPKPVEEHKDEQPKKKEEAPYVVPEKLCSQSDPKQVASKDTEKSTALGFSGIIPRRHRTNIEKISFVEDNKKKPEIVKPAIITGKQVKKFMPREDKPDTFYKKMLIVTRCYFDGNNFMIPISRLQSDKMSTYELKTLIQELIDDCTGYIQYEPGDRLKIHDEGKELLKFYHPSKIGEKFLMKSKFMISEEKFKKIRIELDSTTTDGCYFYRVTSDYTTESKLDLEKLASWIVDFDIEIFAQRDYLIETCISDHKKYQEKKRRDNLLRIKEGC